MKHTNEKGQFDPAQSKIARQVEPQKRTARPPYEISGDELGTLYHGGKRKITAVDPNQLGSRDYGFYGSGFYMAKSPEHAKSYGHRISKFALDPKARVLNAALKSEDASPRLISDLQQSELLHGLPGAQMRGKEQQWREYVDSIPKNHLEWKNALDRFATRNNYHAVRYSDGEIVIKDLASLKPME